MEFRVAMVDAPDARYRVARVHIHRDTWTVVVFDQGMAEIGRYVLDGGPDFVGGSVTGLVDGMPFVVSKDPECSCNGTRKVKKHV